MVNTMLPRIAAKYADERRRAQNTPASAVELEIRLDPLSYENFMALIAAATAKWGPGAHSTSVRIIDDTVVDKPAGGQPTTYINEREFIDGKLSANTWMTKRRIERSARVADFVGYRVGLSLETQLASAWPTTTTALLRHRNRVAFEFTAGAHTWRLDATATITLPNRDRARMQDARDRCIGKPGNPMPAIGACCGPDVRYEVECELVGNPPAIEVADITAAARAIFELMNADYGLNLQYQQELAAIRTAMGLAAPYRAGAAPRLKQTVPQVDALNVMTFRHKVGDLTGYYATLKIDGERAICRVHDGRCVIVMSTRHIEFTSDIITRDCIVDCEISLTDTEASVSVSTGGSDVLVTGGDDASVPTFTLHVFDIIVLGGNRGGPMHERIADLPAACEIINVYLPDGSTAVPKPYTLIADPAADIPRVWAQRSTLTTECDGIIFSRPGPTYVSTHHYKWKPAQYNTIDFVARKCPRELSGKPPYIGPPGTVTFLLFVGVGHRTRTAIGLGLIHGYKELWPDVQADYYPIQFSPSSNPLAYVWHAPVAVVDGIDGKIVEMLPDGLTFKYMRTRHDRPLGSHYFGNDFYVAETIYINTLAPFPLESLWQPFSGYFKRAAGTTDDSTYAAPNRFNRHVIGQVLREHLSGSASIIDAAAGRGGDIHRFRAIGCRRLLALDRDAPALADLIERKYSTRGGGNAVVDTVDASTVASGSMTIYAAHADLTTPWQDLTSLCANYGFESRSTDACVCNFALHYLCDTEPHLRNMLEFVRDQLRPGGHFMFTVMSGAAIHNLVGKKTAKSTTWQTTVDGVVKHRIEKLYRGNELLPFGQLIRIKLPFSDEPMTEPLCNINVVCEIAAEIGFTRVICKKFGDYLDTFARANATMHAALTPGDREYVDLHRVVVLRARA